MLLGYTDKTKEEKIRAQKAAADHTVYRFDLGQNSEGADPAVTKLARELLQRHDALELMRNYPACGAPELRERIARLHHVNPDDVMVTAGIEQAIGMIASAFLGPDSRFIINDPSFYIFENFSTRVGATRLPLALLEEDGFNWTTATFNRAAHLMSKMDADLMWVANPNNPTGKAMSPEDIAHIAHIAQQQGTLLVVDEAYGEYTDSANGVESASCLLPTTPNLIVLRTFSKAFGLAGYRIGYAISQNRKIQHSLEVHGYNYPVSAMSVEVAGFALSHLGYLEETRERTRKRIRALQQRLNTLTHISALDTDSCIFIVKHNEMSAAKLEDALTAQGIIVSPIPGAGEAGQQYVRITIGNPAENEALYQAFAHISQNG